MYKKTVLVFLGHGPDQKRQIQGQEDDAVAAAEREARAREEDEEPDQRDDEDDASATATPRNAYLDGPLGVQKGFASTSFFLR